MALSIKQIYEYSQALVKFGFKANNFSLTKFASYLVDFYANIEKKSINLYYLCFS